MPQSNLSLLATRYSLLAVALTPLVAGHTMSSYDAGSRRRMVGNGRILPTSSSAVVLNVEVYPRMWRCNVCGFTTQDTQQPNLCPVCGSEESFEAFTPPNEMTADTRNQRHTRYGSVGVPREEQEVRPTVRRSAELGDRRPHGFRDREKGYGDPGWHRSPLAHPEDGSAGLHARRDARLHLEPDTQHRRGARRNVAQVEDVVEVGRRCGSSRSSTRRWNPAT